MTENTKTWVYGLSAAFVGGGAAAASACISTLVVAPNEVNLGPQLHHFLELLAITFIVSGVTNALNFLRQSPLPPDSSITVTGAPGSTIAASVKSAPAQPDAAVIVRPGGKQ
jgi:hypothetical protein